MSSLMGAGVMGGFGYVILAALLDIAANGFVSRSDGFRKKGMAVMAVLLVWGAFTLLSFSIAYMELAVAYASWGAMGIAGTAILGYFLNGDKLGWKGWLGMVVMILAVIVMKMG